MKKNKLFLAIAAMFLAFVACNKEQENTSVIDENYAKIEPLLGVFTEKRPATQEEIDALNRENGFASRASCSLDSDAGCSADSTAEFLFYTNNCVTYPTPSFGGFYVTTTLAAISYYVDGDTDVNCDHYEDDLQNMIDNVIASTGPVWNINASVYYVSPCNERSSQNFIVFELTLFTPNP